MRSGGGVTSQQVSHGSEIPTCAVRAAAAAAAGGDFSSGSKSANTAELGGSRPAGAGAGAGRAAATVGVRVCREP